MRRTRSGMLFFRIRASTPGRRIVACVVPKRDPHMETQPLEGKMDNGRFRRIAAIAVATLFLVSTPGFSQDTSVATPPTAGPGAQAPFDTTVGAVGTTIVDTATRAEDDDDGFPWGLLGLLGLLGLMKKPGGTTVVRDTYTPPPVDTRPRNVGTGTATDDRTMNLNPRPGGTTGGTNDPNRR